MDLKSGFPLWLIKNGLPFNYPKLAENLKVDVVIIGGGITGALCAFELTKAGINCAVVDGRTIGLGSTCASTSLLQYELDMPLFELSKLIGKQKAERAYVLCGNAIDTLKELSKDIGYNGFEEKESLYFAAYKKDELLLRNEFAARKAAGFEVNLLGDKEIQKQYGFKSPLAICSSKGASVDAYSLTHKLHQHNIKNGCLVYDRTLVSEIAYNSKSVKLTTADGMIITAKNVVNATGYEIKHFIDKKIVKLNATYVIASESYNQDFTFWKENALLWNTADPYLYIRTTNDRRIIIGGRDEDFYNPVKRDKQLKQKATQLTNDFKKLFPNIPMTPEFSWAGTFGTTKDALPFIGTYDKHPHTYFALGFGGNGITFSSIAARLICDQIKGKSNKDLALFRFNRV